MVCIQGGKPCFFALFEHDRNQPGINKIKDSGKPKGPVELVNPETGVKRTFKRIDIDPRIETLKSLKDIKASLLKVFVLLVSHGHTDSRNYGFGFFLDVSSAILELQRDQFKLASLSVLQGISLAFAKKQDIQKFIDGK